MNRTSTVCISLVHNNFYAFEPSAWSGGWVASAEMPFPWVKAPACGEKFPADAAGLRIAWRGAPRRGADRLNAAALSCPRR